MRTKTNIVMGDGMPCFAKAIKDIYPAGGIAIVYQDKDSAEMLSNLLGETDYRIYLYTIADCSQNSLKDYVRFVVGIGDDEVCIATGKLAQHKSHAFFGEKISCQYFLPSANNCFAEFVFFDKNVISIDNAKCVVDGYVCAFSAMTELILVAYYESAMPFVDKGMHGIIKAIKQLLLCGCDKDKYIEEILRLTKIAMEYLNERGIKYRYIQNAVRYYKKGTANSFLVTYFANAMLLLFTKWNFNDILIPAENLVPEIAMADSFGLDNSLLLSKGELHIISHKVRGQLVLPGIDYQKMFSALKQAVNKDSPLFAGINNRGIIKGISGYD